MSFTLHIPHWVPWALACLGSAVVGWFIRGIAERVAFQNEMGRIFGWR